MILNVYILYAFQQFFSYFYFTWDLQVSLQPYATKYTSIYASGRFLYHQ